MIYPDKGYIGFFDMDDPESGALLLRSRVDALRASGCRRIIAPIDGDTWRRYRLVSWSDGTAAFPLEPQNPLWYNDVYLKAGFQPLAEYSSGAFPLGGVALGGASRGPRIRPFDLSDGENELARIYTLSTQGFTANFLYTDIAREDFLAMYRPLLKLIDPDLAVFAELDGQPAGFLFAFPAGERLILKTITVPPARRGRGIGAAMVHHALRAGQAKGLTQAVAALISDGNRSLDIVAAYGCVPFRRYTLYCLETAA
ncbi:MAG: GNAT family N-acetyltransferase [Gracilibacteraceae bacterium]|jgi:GNAT superfamily N-acetyltransferase|nr:GNAT family N-acetyltransferase [Gracilibacteraceae bacterium]